MREKALRARLKLNHWLIQNPKSCLVILTFFLALLLPGLKNLYTEFNFKVFFKTDDPLLKLYEEYEDIFGNDDQVMAMITHSKGIVQKDILKALDQTTKELWTVKDIKRIDSITNYDFIKVTGDEINIYHINDDNLEQLDAQALENIKNSIQNDPDLKNFLINKNLDMTLVVAQVRNAFKSEGIDYTRLFKDFKTVVGSHFKDLDVRIDYLGAIAYQAHYKDIAFTDLKYLMPLLALIFAVLLFLIYRSFWGVFLPLLVILISLLGMLGFMGHMQFSLNSISTINPAILMTIAVADAIHILTSFFMALDEKYSMKDSLTYSLNKNFYPTLLTSVTTAIGFYSFASAKVKPIAQLGVSVAFGVVFTWIVSYLIFPYFLQKIYKDRNPDATKKLDNPDHFAEKISISKRAHKFTHFLSKFKIPIIIISALIFVTSLYLSSLLEINLHPLEEFPHDHIANRSLRYIENNFGAAVGLQIMIDSGEKDGIKDPVFLKKVDEFSNWLETRPTIDRSIGVHQTIKQLNQRLHRDNPNEYKIPDSRELIAQELFFFTLGLPEGKDIHNRISTHYQHIRLSALWTIHSSKEALDEIAIINKKIDEMGLNAKVTGKNPLLFSLNPYVVQMFFRSFSMALFLITLILIFVLRSIPLGLLALIPNIFPIVFGAGFYYITGNEINVASVLIASVCLGVAVDDSIHFIFEYQKYRLGGMDTKKSIAAILTTTFPALLNTTLVIILGFGAFILGDYVPNQKFGVMSGLILAIALLADITILPAILLLIDRNDKRLSKTNTPS